MTDTPAKYLVIPSSEDRQAHQSDVREARVIANEFNYSTNEYLPAAAQTKWTYFFLGCAILLPWNALANGTSFFLSRLTGSPFYPVFSPYLNSVFTSTKLASHFYCTFTSKQSSPSRRIFASMTTMTLLITSLCLSTFIQGSPSTFFAFALFDAVSLAGMNGYLSTAVYAGAALLGAPFLQAVFSGQAAIGVVISAVQVASSVIALWGSSPEHVLTDATETMRADGRDDQAEEVAARITFGVSAIFLCVTLAAYIWSMRQPFYKSVTSTLEQHHPVGSPDERTGLLADERRNPSTGSNSQVFQVFRKNLVLMFSLVYVFAVTLAVFPAISARVQPVNLGIHPLLFTAVHFLAFNIGDLFGRYSCSLPYLVVWSGKKILAMSLLRTLFVPLILLCNVDHPFATAAPPIICSDVLFMLIILAMGYTNGYVSALALLAVSSLEHNPGLEGRREDVDLAATLGGSFIIVGLVVGSLSSFGVQAMV